ncbi:MAG: metallopeptidase family protein [Minisyncoccia bacterium]
MDEATFRAFAEEAWNDMPEKFTAHIKNVALLVEDEPDEELRCEENLSGEETLLGLYRGVPRTARGAEYGMGGTLPDTITLFRLPILDEARELTDDHTSEFRNNVRKVIRETLWHEVGHYMGFEEGPLNRREDEGTNAFKS